MRQLGLGYTSGWQTFSVKDQIVNTLGFASNIVFVAVTQFCQRSGEATRDTCKGMIWLCSSKALFVQQMAHFASLDETNLDLSLLHILEFEKKEVNAQTKPMLFL